MRTCFGNGQGDKSKLRRALPTEVNSMKNSFLVLVILTASLSLTMNVSFLFGHVQPICVGSQIAHGLQISETDKGVDCRSLDIECDTQFTADPFLGLPGDTCLMAEGRPETQLLPTGHTNDFDG